jgi:hypothetical protein
MSFNFSLGGPVKISDNNIENIYNINININGSFSNNLNQDIVSIVVGLLNEQSIGTADGKTLKERLIELAKSASNKNEKELNIDIPLEGNLNFVSLPDKIREAIEKKQQS